MARKSTKKLEKEIFELKDEISNLKSEIILLQKKLMDRPLPIEPFENPWKIAPLQPFPIPATPTPIPWTPSPWDNRPYWEPLKIYCADHDPNVRVTMDMN